MELFSPSAGMVSRSLLVDLLFSFFFVVIVDVQDHFLIITHVTFETKIESSTHSNTNFYAFTLTSPLPLLPPFPFTQGIHVKQENVLCSITNSPLEAAQLYVHQEMQIPQRTAVW